MEEFLKKMDTFDMILIGLLLVVVFMNFCGKMYKKNRYRSELLEPSISDLKEEPTKKMKQHNKPNPNINEQSIMDMKKLPDVRVNAIKDMTTGGILVDDLPAKADSVGKAYITLDGDSKPSVVQGVRDATELEFRQAYKMDDISPMPLVIPYQQQVFGQNIVVPPADPRMDTRQPSRMGGGASKGSVKVQMVWADWCGYSNKAKKAWPKMQQIVGDSHLGVSIDYEDILEKENKELVAQLKVDGFPTFIMTGQIGGKKINKRFNSVELNDMATKVKKHISDETQDKPKGFISGQIQNDSDDSDKLVEGYTAYSGQYSTPDLSQGVSKISMSDASMVGPSGKMVTIGEDYPKPEDIHKPLLA